MNYIYIYGIVLVASFFVCYFTVPFAIKFAIKKGIIDNPNKDDRRVHKKPTPRAGGMAIIFSMAITLLAYYVASKFMSGLKVDLRFTGFCVGAAIIALMGFLDDLKDLTPLEKFLFQVVAASVIYIFNISIVGIKIPFINKKLIDFGIWAYPITVCWILGITNAVNLIDGLDGLAAGISSISAISLLAIFLINNAPLEVIIIAIALVGATLGFLPYNFNPAKTFMGDVGSNFLGFTLSVVSIMGLTKGYTILTIATPIIILGIPVFDMVFAIVRRLLRHQKITAPDKEHIHHRLLNLGLTQKQAVITLYIATSILGVIAVALTANMKWQIILLIIIITNIIGIYAITRYKSKKKKTELKEDIEV